MKNQTTLITLLILTGMAIPGCKREEPKPEMVTLDQARIERIDKSAGTITVSYTRPKTNEDVIQTGKVTPETEILINGALAKLDDLRIGERVRGEVRIERKDRSVEYVAVKIYVDRADPVGGD